MDKTMIFRIKIKDDELNKVLDDLQKAREMIQSCYNKLGLMGVVEIEKETATVLRQSLEDVDLLNFF